jgi:hypothetical protein
VPEFVVSTALESEVLVSSSSPSRFIAEEC